MMKHVSLIIPSHNEAHRISHTIDVYSRALAARYGEDYEILVVANGCSDDTAMVAQAATTALPQLRIIDIAERVGKGGAVLEGFRQARGNRILFADADASTSPASLLGLVEQLDQADVVIGSRRLAASVISHHQPYYRRLLGHSFALSVRLLFGMPYRDTQCGAKAFRQEANRGLCSAVQETYWAFDVDLLLSCRSLGLRVAEFPVVWSHSAGSQLKVLPTMRDVGHALWRLRRRSTSAIEGHPVFPPLTERGS